MTNKLFIIGNGFDLYHGLKTDYQEFGKFLQQNYLRLYEKMSEYYEVGDDSSLWGEFESALGEFDYSSLEDKFSEFMPNYGGDNFREADRYDLEFYIREELGFLVKELKLAFNEWMSNLDRKVSKEVSLLKLEANSIYLNFNYTDVLVKTYLIDPLNVTYIHNSISDEDLLFGHGWNPKNWSQKRSVKMPEDLSNDERELWLQEQADNYDYSVDRGYIAIDDFFSEIYKNCDDVMANHKEFFSGLSRIDEIYILGHSLSCVDIPYFEFIVDNIDKSIVRWNISWHSPGEEADFKNKLINLGVSKYLIKMIKIQDLI